ncbi:MAG TPA: hypothetical protein VEO91_11120 [Candidatus Limnocylindria bacterium]|nr:hypothetical protein [Candidatus Limnocylindria bacterium]
MTEQNDETGPAAQIGEEASVVDAPSSISDMASSAWDAVKDMFDGGAGTSGAADGANGTPGGEWELGGGGLGIQPPVDWDAHNEEMARKRDEAIKGGMDEWEATITYKFVDPQNPDAIN